MSKKVIEYQNLPAKPPLFGTLVVWLSLDRWHAAPWLWGAIGALMLLIWISYFYGLATQQRTDIFKERP